VLRRFFLSLFALFSLLVSVSGTFAAQAYIIVDSKTGYVFQEHNSRQKRQVASLTKIATAMVALDWAEKQSGDLNQIATIPPEALAAGGENNVGFQAGDTATLRDLLYAALVQSDNIAAYTLAAHIGEKLQGVLPAGGNGSPVATFVGQMNALAANLKMDRTRFMNPSGLDDVKPFPYSTAMDMARLTRYAMDKAAFRFYVSQKERQIAFTRAGKPMGYMLRNTNELLGVNGIQGVKTGRTARAGDCLILSAQRQSEVIKQSETTTTVFPRHLIVVLLASPNRFVEGEQLLNVGWQLHDQWVAAGRPTNPKKTL
jgi:D-alanyl-D-alanine carboxypeptidase (penicillin-binding protein 5/6)